MSMREYPIVDTGLFITPEIAAYINLYADRKRNRVPKLIQDAINAGQFETMVKDHDNTLLNGFDYFNADTAHDELWEPDIDIQHIYCNQFTGTVDGLSCNPTDDTLHMDFDDEFIAYIQTAQGRVWDKSEKTLDLMVKEFKGILSDILPKNFDIKSYLVEIEGTDFS